MIDLTVEIPAFLFWPYAVFLFCQGGLLYWNQKIEVGRIGRAAWAATVVVALAQMSAIFVIIFVAAAWYDFGWQAAAWCVGVQLLLMFTVQPIAGAVFGFLYEFVGALGVMALAFPVATNVSWFGFF